MSASSTPKIDGIDDAATGSPFPDASPPIHGAIELLVALGTNLTDIVIIGRSIETALNKIPKTAPGKQDLTTVVRAAVTGTQELLSDVTQVSAATKALADDLHRLLQVVLAHLHGKRVYGKRAQLKSLFTRPSTPLQTYHAQIQEAFDALKNSIPAPITLTPQDNTMQRRSTLAATNTDLQNATIESSLILPAAAKPTTSKVPTARIEPEDELANVQKATDAPKKDGRWSTVVDAVESGLRVVSGATDFIPDPAGPIVKLMAGTGLTIIGMLKGMEGNREEAMNLGRHIGTLIQTVERFLQQPEAGTPDSCDAETAKQLRLFLDALQSLEGELVGLKAQGKFKQGVSHTSNKDDLVQWGIIIDRAFSVLQTQLSLSSIRLLTKMSAADALRERDRLIGLLGDGDTGATEKAADSADLMCLPGTRTAVLDQVNEWIADSSGSRTFWISGVAGCGKSAVAATIAGRPHTVPTSTAIFHFVRGNQDRNKRVICSLSRQLARFGHSSLEHFVLSGVQANPDITTSHLTEQFRHLVIDPLGKLVPGSPPVILVLDALDEWDNHDAAAKLVELIRQAHAELPHTVRFVLTSRNESHLVKPLDCTAMKPYVTRCQLDGVLKSDTRHDVRFYIQKRFATLRAQSDVTSDGSVWPEERNIDQLVGLSDGLFQWASTVMSYIAVKRPRGRLREILKNPEQYAGLDNLYQGVLEVSFRGETNTRVLRLLQNVLGSILTASVPIDVTTIAYLSYDGIDTMEETLELIQEEILPSLASLLIIPNDPRQPITVSHPSVIDFATSEARCLDNRFHIHLTIHHARMFNACFQLMESNLKRDICGINNPSTTNREVQNLVAKHIPGRVRYACLYWITHLTGSDLNTSAESRDRLGHFSRNHLLHWLEVMSLTGVTTRATHIAREFGRWWLGCPSLTPADIGTISLWRDLQRFVAKFYEPISTAAAHLYISALPFAPTETELVRQFSKTIEPCVRAVRGPLDKQWPASVWTARGHKDAVKCVAFSSNGRTIASGSGDATIRLWDADTGAPKCDPLEGHTKWITCLSVPSDGRIIASGSADTTIRLWDADTGAPKGGPLEGHMDWVTCLSFSSDGQMIASGSNDATIRLWNTKTGALKCDPLEGHTGSVTCISISSVGRMIASGSDDATIRLWDGDTGTPKGDPLEGHSDEVNCLAFSSDCRMVASGSNDATIRLWDADTGTQKCDPLEGHTGRVLCLSFSSDDQMIASGSGDATIRLWDADTGTPNGDPLEGHTDWVTCLSLSSDGRVIASGSTDTTIRLWDAATGAPICDPLVGHTEEIHSLSFSSDGRMIVSGSGDSTIRLWDAEAGAPKGALQEGHTEEVRCLSFSSDGRIIASGSDDTTIWLWDADTGTPKCGPLKGHRRRVSCLSFSSDGRIIASGSADATIRLWGADTGASKCDPLEGHTDWVSCLSFSSDGRLIASGSDDATVRLWDTHTGALMCDPLKGHAQRVSCLSFSSNDRIIASGSRDGTIRLWDADTGSPRGKPLEGHSGEVNCLFFSPNGTTIVSGSDDATVRFWDVDSAAQQGAPLTGANGRVSHVSLSTDRLTLFCNTYEGNSREWDLAEPITSLFAPTTLVSETHQSPVTATHRGSVSADGWIFHRNVRWLWVPLPGALWLLNRSRLALYAEENMYLIDVSEVLYIVE